MADPVVGIVNGVPTSGTGNITTLGQTLLDGANATIGITTGAAVTTSAAGTLQQYLRGIVSLLVSGITVASHAVTNAGTFAVQATLTAGSLILGKVGIDQTTPGTTDSVTVSTGQGAGAAIGTTSAAAVVTDANGTLQQYLRGLVKLIAAGINVVITNANANGPAVSASSAPVVIASDQAAVSIQLAAVANLVSGAITTAMTGTTSTSLVAAPGSSLHNMITQVTVSNSHATVGTDIVLQDGSSGTTIYTIPAAANYGGATITFNPPLRQPTANTALFVANVTTGASTKASASGFKAA